ncbi:MAG: PAS domain S-box protein [Acidobacteriota bacterium]
MPSTWLMLALAALTIGLVVVQGVQMDRAVQQEVVARFSERQLMLVEQTAASIQADFDEVQRDLLYLRSATSSTAGLADTLAMKDKEGRARWKRAIEQNLLAYLSSHTIYAQIRYVDSSGLEILGVDTDGQTVRVIPDGELRQQAGRDFFRATMNLGAGEVYVSRPEPALGHGRVGVGLPAVRFATLVLDSQGRRQGMIVINLMADKIRAHIAHLSTVEGLDAWVLDENGIEIINMAHPEREGSNAYEYCRQTGDRTLIALTEDMRTGGEGVRTYLWPEQMGGPLAVMKLVAFSPVHPAEGRVWSVGTSVTYESILAAHRRGRTGVLLLGGCIVLAILLVAAVAVWSGRQRAAAEERARLSSVLSRRNEELEALRETSLAITSQLGLDGLLQNIVKQGCRLLGSERGSIYLVDEASGHLKLAVSQGHTRDYAGLHLEPGEGIAGRVLQSGAPLAVDDYRHWEGRSRGAEPLSAALGAPLKHGEEVIGVLGFARTTRGESFDEHDIWLATLFASQAAVAIENARLYEQSQREITERKQAEEEIRIERDKVQGVLAAIGDGVDVTTYDYRVLYANDNLKKIVGKDRLVGQLCYQVFVGRDAPCERCPMRRAIEHGRIEIEEILQPNGRTVEVSASPLKLPSGEMAAIEIAKDITGRKQAEAELRQLKEFNESIIQSMSEGIVVDDADGYLTFVNPAAAAMLGYAPQELVGQHWRITVPPDQGHIVRAADERRMRGEADRYELELVRKDGQRLCILVSGSPRFEADRFVGTFAVFSDITERKRAEEWVRQQDRLAAVGQLAAGIAHDFNNLLTGIIGYAQLLQGEPGISDRARGKANLIAQQGLRASHLVRQILDFSRQTVIHRHPLDLAPFLQETCKLLQRTFPENIRLLLETEPGPQVILGDPTQVQEVVANLALNARDAMPAGGELRIRLSPLSLHAGDRVPVPEMAPGEWITLAISDTGTGIAPAVLPRIFEPFFTTKAPGAGTGLGLAQVHGIVKQHNGYIGVESRVGQGATFTIYLPAIRDGRGSSPQAPRLEEAVGGRGEVILLVENEPAVLEVLRQMLAQMGYRVLTATDGEEALAVYRQRSKEIALVLTDLIMPRMDGAMLLRALRAEDPQVKVVAMTGYPLGDGHGQLLAEEVVDWVQKPIDNALLALALRRALG